MLFRQLFDMDTCTYTYIIASKMGGEAAIIDPVKEHVAEYVKLLSELNIKLVFAIDTHVHADHITGIGALRLQTDCMSVMGDHTRAECVSLKVKDGEIIKLDNLQIKAMYTPGHTDDSFSFLLNDRVFTGDTLLIRGTGRTDFQNGSAEQSYASIFNCLLQLPGETFVYPAHDYNGQMCSTIYEERNFNPRLQVKSLAEYVELMENLNLPNPKYMDIAVPANLQCGLV